MNKLIYFVFWVAVSAQGLYSEYAFVEGKLSGQLGNQMFIVATTYAHALEHGATAVFPDFIEEGEVNSNALNKEKVFFRLNFTKPQVQSLPVYSEGEDFLYKKIPFYGNMKLQGFFQSEKYFKGYRKEILELFEPSAEISEYIENKYRDILEHPKTVSIHIRTYHDTCHWYHPFVGWKYVRKAMNRFDEDSLFLIFSDNIAVCERTLGKEQSKKCVFIKDNPHYVDLYLMSMCKNHILSNSSFSWWGAYLNKNPQKKVISPYYKKWFGRGLAHLKTDDIIPDEWEQLI